MHQGTGGDFEATSTWGGEGGGGEGCVQNNRRELRTVLIKNPEGNTCYDSIQVDVGEGFHAQRREVTLRTRQHRDLEQPSAVARRFIKCASLTSSHSVAPTLPYSPALQLANTMLLLGLNPSVIRRRSG